MLPIQHQTVLLQCTQIFHDVLHELCILRLRSQHSLRPTSCYRNVADCVHRLHGHGENVTPESARVQEAGAWIDDGRVCDILAVSRAFGDREFKGEGLPVMLRKGVT